MPELFMKATITVVTPEPISDRVRRLCNASSDSDLAESALILAYAYDEKNAAIERMLKKMEVIG